MSNKQEIRSEGILGLAAWTGQSRGMQSAHQHFDLEINYVLSGNISYLIGGRLIELQQQRICLLWGSVVHQMIRNSQPAEAIWVTIPLAQVLRWGLPDHLIRPLLGTGFVADPMPLSSDQELLCRWIDDLAHCNDDTSPVRDIVLLEIEARLRRCAMALFQQRSSNTDINIGPPSDVSRNSPAHNDRGLVAVEAMAYFMSQNFQNDISVATIAEPAHLHPNYAMTLFHHHTGMTISQYLTLQRVAHAQRLLATTSDSIPTIALNSGFGSLSRFHEAFRQQTGNSPRRFRLHLESKQLKRVSNL